LQEGKLLEHHETELCSPSHRFGPTVHIELGENGSDVKLSGVEGDSQPTCDGFVGDAVCHRSKYFELAGGGRASSRLTIVAVIVVLRLLWPPRLERTPMRRS
jgi:hypothetical protein